MFAAALIFGAGVRVGAEFGDSEGHEGAGTSEYGDGDHHAGDAKVTGKLEATGIAKAAEGPRATATKVSAANKVSPMRRKVRRRGESNGPPRP